MQSLEEQNLVLKHELKKKTHVIERQQQTISEYETKFVELSTEIEELTKRLYKNTTTTNEEQEEEMDSVTIATNKWTAFSKELVDTASTTKERQKKKSNFHSIPYPLNERPNRNKKEFQYVESSRCKRERSKMIGETCTCCEKFYNDGQSIKINNKIINSKERIQTHSRHRSKFKRQKTPPGFWDIDFPSDNE